MDIFSVLKQDHDEARALLSIWLCRPEGRNGELTWERWSDRWEIHVRIEENFLFPFLRMEPALRLPLAEAFAAHARIRERMQDVHVGIRYTEAWLSAAVDLLGDLESLMELEKARIFPIGKTALSREEAEELGLEVLDFMHGLRPALAAGS